MDKAAIKITDAFGSAQTFELIGNNLTINKMGLFMFTYKGKVIKLIVL